MTLSDATERIRQTKMWLIVNATSASSKECEIMNRTTLSNSKVVAWIEAHGFAISIDVGAEPAQAAPLAVRVVPTLIAFKEGQERERLRGLRSSSILLLWLRDLQRKRQAGYVPPIKDEEDVSTRRRAARALLDAGSYPEASEHYVWLWNNMTRVDPHLAGVRRSFLARDIDSLVRAWPEAEARFGALRDEAAAMSDADPNAVEVRLDWIVLNSVLGDEEQTISWFDSVRADRSVQAVVKSVGRHLVDPLRLRSRWADLGRLYSDPIRELTFQYEVMTEGSLPPSEMLGADLSRIVGHVALKRFRTNVAELCSSLRAAGRMKEAKEVEDEALRLDPSDDMRIALRAATAPHN